MIQACILVNIHVCVCIRPDAAVERLLDSEEAAAFDEDESYKSKDTELQDSNVTLKQCLDSFVTTEVSLPCARMCVRLAREAW
jgi:hypothetical protein